MVNFIKSFSGNLDFLTLAVTIFLTAMGWIFALWLQQKGAKQQHKIQIQYEIYKQFVQLHKEVQNVMSVLNAHSSPPFILMESSMIPFQLGLKKQYKDVWLLYSEQECLFDGEKKWTTFIQELHSDYLKFSEKMIQFSHIFEDWEGALQSLLPTKKILYLEIEDQKKIITQQLSELQSYASKHSHDWRKWDQKDVEALTEKMRVSVITITSYLSDFMVLIHNQLLSAYFGHSRPTRKTLDPQYKVLTEEGIIENVDRKFLQNTEKWKAQLYSLLQANQQYIVDDACSRCGATVLIIESKEVQGGIYFGLACGHAITIEIEVISAKNKS